MAVPVYFQMKDITQTTETYVFSKESTTNSFLELEHIIYLIAN